jgi:predicted metal-dependent phosphoesterase TrpH
MGSEIPEWAMEEARVALISHPGKYDPMLERVARALVAAERRGIERAAKVAEDRKAICADAVAKVKSGELYADIPTALASESCAHLEASHIVKLIRQLGDTP